jgi:hypothetical protein
MLYFRHAHIKMVVDEPIAWPSHSTASSHDEIGMKLRCRHRERHQRRLAGNAYGATKLVLDRSRH